VAALVSSVVLSLIHSPIAPLPGVVTLLFIPGAAVLSNLGTRPANTAGRIVLAVCLSMTVVMVIGFVASVMGQPIGIAHPLSATTQSILWSFLAVVLLVVSAVRRRDPVMWIVQGVNTSQLFGVLASGLLVVISILGVAQLNNSGNNGLAIFSISLDVVVLLAGVVIGWKRTNRWPFSTLLYFASLAFLLSTSLRGGHLYGWDIQEEFGVAAHAIKVGAWDIPANGDPYASMLSLTVLPAILHSLVKLRLLAFFQLVVPAILALLPVAVFSTVRNVPRWITSGRSLPRPGLAYAVVVGLVISSVAYSSVLMSVTRQAMALTLLTGLVMVLFDRTVIKRRAQILVGVLLVAIAFTHYTTSYLLAAIFVGAWVGSWMWSSGWIGISRAKIERHRHDVRSRKVLNLVLVGVAIVAAFGWNLGVTRNTALQAPASALTAKGAGISSSIQSETISARQFEQVLVSQLKKIDSYIVPVRGASSIHIVGDKISNLPGLVSALFGSWSELNFLTQESQWILLGIALAYGLFRLARRRSYEYSADLVGLGIAGLLVGGVLRFSGTLASFYSPERAAIFTVILLAAPMTLFLDDFVDSFSDRRIVKTVLGAGAAFLVFLVVQATGLGTLLAGGQPPGSLTADGVNAEDFTVSTQELATAVWLREHVTSPDIVQSDLFGQLALLSEPGSYDLISEIVPPEVDSSAYIYLTPVNLFNGLSQAGTSVYQTSYRSNVRFFNRNFYVVYSTGSTRVYH
jgi:uncharacterized membrane protein